MHTRSSVAEHQRGPKGFVQNAAQPGTYTHTDPHTTQSNIKMDVMLVKKYVATLPLSNLLMHLSFFYRIERFVPESRLSELVPEALPLVSRNNSYHALVALQARYKVAKPLTQGEWAYQMISTIQNHLQWHRDTIDHYLAQIDAYHGSQTLRQFVAWAYERYKVNKRETRFGYWVRWNPHYINSTSRVKNEAIAYFDSPTFKNDKGHDWIYVKHIVCLLRGAPDWRCAAGDRLVSHHPTPAQMSRV